MVFGCLPNISACFRTASRPKARELTGPSPMALRMTGDVRTTDASKRLVPLEGAAPDVPESNDCMEIEISVDSVDDSIHLDGAALDAVKSCVADVASRCTETLRNNSFFAILRDGHLKAKVQLALEQEGQKSRQQTKYITDAFCVVVVFQRVSTGESPTDIMAGQLMTALHKKQFCTLATSPSGAECSIRTLLSRPMEEKVQCVMPIFTGQGAVGPMYGSSYTQVDQFIAVY